MATAADALNLARSKLGYAEGPKNNETVFGAWSGFQLQPWCCSFTSWVLDQVGLGMGKIAYCPTAVAYWKAKGRLFATPQVGDQALYFWNGRYAHTGLVERVDGDSIIAIEGNTNGAGSAEGGAVMRKQRPWRGTKTVFGRPAYQPPRQQPPPAVTFGMNPPLIMPPIVAEYVPPEGGLRLVAEDGAQFNFLGSPYTGPEPGRRDHDPVRLEPLVDVMAAPGGGFWLLAVSGAVYALLGSQYHGGANEGADTYFKGFLAARLEPHPTDPAKYCIRSTVAEPAPSPVGRYCDFG